MSRFKVAWTCLVSLGNSGAAVSSSLGILSRFSEATLVLEQTRVDMAPVDGE